MKKTQSNPTQVSYELSVDNLEKKYGKSMYGGSVLEWCLHRESWLCLHYIMTLVIACPGAVTYVSTSPIKPVSPKGQKQSETFVSSVKPHIALCTKQPQNKCLQSCVREQSSWVCLDIQAPWKMKAKVTGEDGLGGRRWWWW